MTHKARVRRLTWAPKQNGLQPLQSHLAHGRLPIRFQVARTGCRCGIGRIPKAWLPESLRGLVPHAKYLKSFTTLRLINSSQHLNPLHNTDLQHPMERCSPTVPMVNVSALDRARIERVPKCVATKGSNSDSCGPWSCCFSEQLVGAKGLLCRLLTEECILR